MSNESPLTADGLVRILFGSSAFQMLNAGVRLGLFGLLAESPNTTKNEICERLGIGERPVQILLLGTTSLGLTVCADGRYSNAAVMGELFPGDRWTILEDLVEFEAKVVQPAETDFTESLRQDTNVGLRRIDGVGDDLYHRIASQPDLEALFYRCMRSWSRLSNPVLVEQADLSGVRRVLDVGGGDAVNAIALAKANPGVEFTVLDLPGATDLARERIEQEGLAERIDVRTGDIFASPYPAGHDCVLFANQLVIWSPEQNIDLLRAAYAALPEGGKVLVFSAIANDTGDGPLYAALDNVYFATVPAANSTVYHWGQYEEWMATAGFSDVQRCPGGTWTPHGVVAGRR